MMNGSRYPAFTRRFRFPFCFLFLFLSLLAYACDSGSSDVDSQLDGDLEQEEEASIPQEIHHCFGGNKQADRCETASDCEAESRCGEAPQGVSYTCSEGVCRVKPLDGEDGDEDQAMDYEQPDCTDEQTGRAKIDCLPTCWTGNATPRPCKLDFHFKYLDDEGRFEIGQPGGYRITGIDAWNGWAAFYYSHLESGEPTGLMLFDYPTKQTARFSIPGDSSFWPSLGGNRLAWTKHNSGRGDDLYTTRLDNWETRLAVGVDTYIGKTAISERGVFWDDGRTGEGSERVYTINEETGEEKLLSSKAMKCFDVYDNMLVYLFLNDVLMGYNLDTGVEEAMMADEDSYYARAKMKLWERKAYFSNVSLATTNPDCSYSVMEVDLDTKTTRVVVPRQCRHEI